MLKFSRDPDTIIKTNSFQIPVFSSSTSDENTDIPTVESFGDEWSKFSEFSAEEISKIGKEYFDIVDEKITNKNHTVLDLGCGTGRWSKYLSDKVKFIEAVDPSNAVYAASNLLKNILNIRIIKTDIDNLPFDDESFDFSMSLGVLHHIPDTKAALKKLVQKTKINGHVLLYLYYNLDNRGFFYKLLFHISNIFRKLISKSPSVIKFIICELIAFLIYLPFVYLARFVRLLISGDLYKKLPLSYYVDKSIWVIRNDALDRFGTPVEQRFSKNQIQKMMIETGLSEINFSQNPPYWHVTGKRIK